MVATVPVRMMRFSSIAVQAGDLRDRLLERDLDFGERRDRHPGRQVGVEHMVLAHIGVGEHIVAERLAVAEAGAMAEHQPGMRAQHGDVVGDGLGVGRADADIDHGDAAHGPAASGDRPASAAGARRRPGAGASRARRRGHDVAGLDEGFVAGAALGHHLAGPWQNSSM